MWVIVGRLNPSTFEDFRIRLEKAKEYSEIWKVVKDTVEYVLGKRRRRMILFLDDLPLRLGAYPPIGYQQYCIEPKFNKMCGRELDIPEGSQRFNI